MELSHIRNFIDVKMLKEIDRDIFHFIFPWTIEKDTVRRYNTMDPWNNLSKEFQH